MSVEGAAGCEDVRARFRAQARRRAWMRLLRRALVAYWLACVAVIAYGLSRLV